jgi:hypothetical protein
MKTKQPLVADVLSRTLTTRHGTRTWIESLSADAQAELEAVKAKFDPALHQKKAFAEAVMAACGDRGWKTCGVQGVIDWLNKKT